MTHHTFPNGAVQGGAFAKPGTLEAKLKEMGLAPKSYDERLNDLMAAFVGAVKG